MEWIEGSLGDEEAGRCYRVLGRSFDGRCPRKTLPWPKPSEQRKSCTLHRRCAAGGGGAVEPAGAIMSNSSTLAAAIEAASEELLVALQRGEGRLLKDANGEIMVSRNNTFSFKESDVLAIERSITASAADLCVVTSTKGEIGEVLRTCLLRLIPPVGQSMAFPFGKR